MRDHVPVVPLSEQCLHSLGDSRKSRHTVHSDNTQKCPGVALSSPLYHIRKQEPVRRNNKAGTSPAVAHM